MCKGTETICPICGSTIVQSGKGKPREYCDDDCKNIFKYHNALERLINTKNINSKKHASALKGSLFRTANLIVIPHS